MVDLHKPSLSELRKLSSGFRSIFSRTVRSEPEVAMQNLRRLRAFVEGTPLLYGLVAAAPLPNTSPLEELREATSIRGRMDFPLDPAAELGFVHGLIVELTDSDSDFLAHSRFYAGKFGFDSVPEVLGDLLEPYFSHLNRAIEGAMIDALAAEDVERGIRVEISGGTSQVNIAQHKASLQAHQELTSYVENVRNTADKLLAAISTEHPDDGEEFEAVTVATVEEASRPTPRPAILRTFAQKIGLLASAASGSAEVSKHANTLVEQVTKLIHSLG